MIKTVYVLHHSHTDIGYTHAQSQITRWHGDYIQQAMDIAESRDDFRWTCETFYPVEEFWRRADVDTREHFKALCRKKRIGLTSGYFHLTELPDTPLLASLARRSRVFADEQKLPLRVAMMADVNGCLLAHARCLADTGTDLLLTCVHPHHGYPPLHRRQQLFRWDLGDGRSLAVCHLDHYHIGNSLGLAPGGKGNYVTRFQDEPERLDDDVLDRRLPVYLAELEEGGWPHDFAILTVSGLNTDNAPPSAAVADRIARWNLAHGDSVRLEMVSPEELAEIVDKIEEMPVYQGDWPDWWADGVAGDPEAVALFRYAQRERARLVAMADHLPDADSRPDLSKLDTALGLFAEHTFGHSASVSHPWNLLAQQLGLNNCRSAAEAADAADLLFDETGRRFGGGAMAYDRPPVLRCMQPFGTTVRDLVELEIEEADALRHGLENGRIRVVRRDNGEVLPHQPADSMRGLKALVDLTLTAGESVDLRLEACPPAKPRQSAIVVPGGSYDIEGDAPAVKPSSVRTDTVEIDWSETDGIVAWRDAATGRSLLSPEAKDAPFTLVASRHITPADGESQCSARENLGRNRNAADCRWERSHSLRLRAFTAGVHRDDYEFDCSLEGCEFLRLRLSPWQQQRRVDVEILMHKTGSWDTENLYLALPFSAGEKSEFWVDRGLHVRPWIDQLPGTLADFMGIQDGLAWSAPGYGVAVAQKDSHLIQLGPLEYGARQLSDSPGLAGKLPQPYVWLMSNYWETNFSAELGGFYSFRFSVCWGEELSTPDASLTACRMANSGIRAIRLAE